MKSLSGKPVARLQCQLMVTKFINEFIYIQNQCPVMISYIFKTNVLKLDAKFVFNKVKNKMKYMPMLSFSFLGKKTDADTETIRIHTSLCDP